MYVRRAPQPPVDAAGGTVPVFGSYLSSLHRYKAAYANVHGQLATLQTTITMLRERVWVQQDEIDTWRARADATDRDLRVRVIELAIARVSQRDAELDREHMRRRLRDATRLAAPWPIPPIPGPEDASTRPMAPVRSSPQSNQVERNVRNLARTILDEQMYPIGITPDFHCNCTAATALKRLYRTRSSIFTHQSDAGTQTRVPPMPESSEGRCSRDTNWRWFAQRFQGLTGASGAVF